MDDYELEDHELATACEKGDLLKVQELFKDPGDLRFADTDETNPLMCAVKNGHLNIIQFLLNKVGDVNFADDCSKTTLHYACEEGVFHIVKWLLDNGADANAKDISDYMPIHLASQLDDQSKSVEIIRLLLDHGADPRALNNEHDSAIILAFQYGNVGLIKLFKEHNFDIDLYKTGKYNVSPFSRRIHFEHHNLLHLAVQRERKDLVSYLIGNGVDFKDTKKIGFDCFCLACWTDNIDFIKFIWKTVYHEDLPDDTKRNAFHTAAIRCEVPVLELLIEMGCNCDVLNNYLETPLMAAIVCSKKENLEFLLESGMNVNNPRFDGKTALHLYCQEIFRSGPVLEKILTKSKDIDITDNAQRTPLHYAAMKAYSDIIKFLIKHGADQKAVDRRKATPLHYYSGSKNVKWDSETFECLVRDVGTEAIDEHRKTPLHYAADSASLGYFEQLVAHGANVEAVSDEKGSVLHHTLAAHCWSKAELLLQKGVFNDEPNKEGRTPFLCSIRSMELAKMLLEKGANMHALAKDGQTALHLACQGVKSMSEYTGEEWSPPEDVVKLLVEQGCNVNTSDNQGRTPLHIAYESGKDEVINVLLSNGADKEAIDNDGKNILHYAAQCINVDIVKNIFDVGLNVPDKKGNRPLVYAHDPDTLNYLIEHTDNIKPDEFRNFFPVGKLLQVEHLKIVFEGGASVNTRNGNGNTMLHHYTNYLASQRMRFLLEKGSDVNARNRELVTPLHMAVDQMQLECIKLLIEHGADISAEDKDKRTVLDRALESEKRCEPIVAFLIETLREGKN